MSTKRLRFNKSSEVTNPGDDSRSFLFIFSMAPLELIGTPEEASATTEHRLIVTIANNRLPSWNLAECDLIKVLFEIGANQVVKKLAAGTLRAEERVMVSTETHSKICPFDPARIQEPNGAVREVEEDRKIGFK